MPVDSHLTWAEVRDFTAGLWTAGDQLMPPNAAQTMLDCYGLPGGGLRAWFKATSITTSGVVSIANERLAGLYVRGGVNNRTGGGTSEDRYMLTYNPSDLKCRLYRMDLTNNDVAWSLLKTFAAGGDARWAVFDTMLLNSGAVHVYVSVRNLSTDDGVWSINYADGVMAKVVGTVGSFLYAGPLVVHQSRLIVADAIQGQITFSDPGAETGLGTNTITTEPSRQLARIIGLGSFSPGDLLVHTVGAPFYLVEGDLSNYTLRQMNNSVSSQGLQSMVFGPQGVIVAFTGDGVYETPDGSVMAPLSKPLAGADINPFGTVSTNSTWANLAFFRHWLYLGKGLIYDYDTHCWFKTSFVTGSGGAVAVERAAGTLLAGQSGTNFTLMQFTLNETAGSDAARCETWTWKSAPLRDPNGRQVEIRALQVYARSRNGATSSITVTVNGVAQTLACDSSGRGGLTFYFLARKEQLDIQIDAASNAAGVEAPLVEALRIGSQAGHFLRQVADAG